MATEQQLLDITMLLNRAISTVDKIYNTQLKDNRQLKENKRLSKELSKSMNKLCGTQILLSQRVDEIHNEQQVIAKRMDKRKIRLEVDPVVNPQILAIASGITASQFTLSEFKEYLPDGVVTTDRQIGSTLLHNGYRKKQVREGYNRKWVYERVDQPQAPTAEPEQIQEQPSVRVKSPEEIRQITKHRSVA